MVSRVDLGIFLHFGGVDRGVTFIWSRKWMSIFRRGGLLFFLGAHREVRAQ